MPTLSLIEAYASNVSSVETQYFGSITWLFPVLNRFLNEDIVMRISNTVDEKLRIKKSAFQFTMKAIKS